MALLYISCNLLPVRHPWRRYHGCGGGRSSPPEHPPPPPIPPDPGGKATTVLGSPSASGLRSDHSRPLLSHLLLWDGWWMGFSRQRSQF